MYNKVKAKQLKTMALVYEINEIKQKAKKRLKQCWNLVYENDGTSNQ